MSRTTCLLVCACLLSSVAAFADIRGDYYKFTPAISPPDAFNPANFRGTRVDANVNFAWGSTVNPWPDVLAPAATTDVDGFAIRWRGQVLLPSGGAWTFYTASDDGARLWIDGVLQDDHWVDQGGNEWPTAALTLTAGWHDIRMEYYENAVGAAVSLSWSGPDVAKAVIPQASLTPYTESAASTASQGIQSENFNFFSTTTFPVPAASVFDDIFTTTAGATAGYCAISHTVSTGDLDPNVNFNWGTGPGGQADYFGSRWRGQVLIPTGGVWTFYTSTDDGSRVYIDGASELTIWQNQGAPAFPGTVGTPVMLGPGWHDIRMDYFENTGGSSAQLNWSGPGVAAATIPQASLRPYFEHGLIAQFYSNSLWSTHGGSLNPLAPNLVRVDGPMDSNWDVASPDTTRISVDNFAGWYRGKVLIPGTPGTSGTYKFWALADDHVDVYVNGTTLMVNNPWANEGVGSVVLTAGVKYFIDVRFSENGGGALCYVKYSGPGIGDGSDGARVTIPLANLYSILNEPPSNIALSNATIGNVPSGTPVGNLTTTDIDNSTGAGSAFANQVPTQTFTYSLVAGTGSTNNASFSISGATLQTAVANLNAGTYNVRVRTTDNGTQPDNQYFEKALTITVVDTTAPTAGTPTPPAYANASPIVIPYSGASDTGGSGLASVALWFKKGAGGTWTDSGLTQPGASGSFNFTTITGEATYYFGLRATDNAGNSGAIPSGSGQGSTIYDITPPTCSVTGPASPTNANPIDFTINFSESVSGLTAAGITVTNGSKGALSGSGSGPYTMPVTPSGDGHVTCTVTAGAAHDAATNGNTASAPADVISDRTQPGCTVSTSSGSPTNISPIPFQIQFAESVSGFIDTDVSVTGGSVTGFSGSGSLYGVQVTPSGNGTVTCSVSAGVAADAATNTNTAGAPVSVQFDSVQPIPTVTAPGSPTNANPMTFTIGFSKSVTGLTTGGVTVVNGSASGLSGSGAGPYSLSVTPSGQGLVTCQVQAAAAHDIAGNQCQASNVDGATYDSIAPSCAVTGPVSPTNGSPITFTLSFGEPVHNLNASMITVTGGTKGTPAGVGPGPLYTAYTLDVTPTVQGAVTCEVLTGAAQDAAGNGNSVSNNLSITYDSLAPSCVVTGPASPTNGSPITFTLTFGEPVHNLNASSITVTGGTAGSPAGVGPGPYYTVYTLDVTPGGQGAVTCQVQAGAAQDAAGNGNAVSNNRSITYDSLAPTCTVTGPATPTNANPITFTITFNEVVTGLAAANINVTGGSKGALGGSGTTYTLPVAPAGQGPVTCQVIAGAAQDAAGNGNAVSNDLSITYDSLPPTCIVTGPSSPTNLTSILFTLTFSESVTGLTAGGITVNNGTKGSLTGGGDTYVLSVSPVTDGPVTCQVQAGAAQDAASNPNTVSNELDVTYDSAPPTCSVTGPVGTVSTSPIVLTLTFGEPVTGLTSGAITVTGGAASALTGLGTTYTLDVMPSGNGTVTCEVPEGAAIDAAGNGNEVSNLYSVVYESARPACNVTAARTAFNSNPIAFTITFSEPVTSVDIAKIDVTGATKDGLTGTGAEYTLSVTATVEGPVTCHVQAGAAASVSAGQPNTESNTLNVTYDVTLPTCIVTGPASPTNASPLTFTLTFSEPVTGLTLAGLVVGNGFAGDPVGSGSSYTVSVSALGQGPVTCQVSGAVAQDAAGNGNVASNTLSVTYDSVAPTCVVTGPASPTNDAPIVFTLTFSEPVTGLTAAGIDVTNGAKGALSTTDQVIYSLEVTASSQGAVTCQVQASAAQDAAGNGGAQSNLLTLTYDSVAPTCVVTGPASPTNVAPVVFTLTFSKALAALSAADVDVTGGTKGALATTDQVVYTLEVTPSGQGAVTCVVPANAAQDAAGNGNVASNTLSVTYDSLEPACVVTGPASPTNSAPITFTLTFSEPVTGLQSAGVVVTNGVAGLLAGSGDTYALPVTPSGQGAVTCHVVAGAAQDAPGNGNLVSNTLSVTYDTVAPTCTVTAPPSPVHTPPITFTINFSEPVTDLTATDVLFTNAIVTGTLTGGGSGPYTISVTPLAMGDVTCQVSENVAQDAAGNGNALSNEASVNYDNPNPNCWITGPASPTNSASIECTIDFSSPVTGLTVDEIVVTNGTKGALTGAGMSYSISITPAGQGAVTCQVPADAAQDSGAHGNLESSLFSIVYDSLAPTATLTLNGASPTSDDTLVFDVVFSEDIGTSFTASEVTVNGSVAVGSTVSSVVQGIGNAYQVTVALGDPNADGTLGITIGAGVHDLAGNAYPGDVSPPYTIYNWLGFTDQPDSTNAYVGETTSFSVSADHGNSVLSYQWKYDDLQKAVHDVGDNSPTYTIPSVVLANAGDYWCVVTYGGIDHVSDHAVLSVADRVLITQQPVGGAFEAGQDWTLTVAAEGGFAPLEYQWSKGGTSVLGATEASLTLSNLQPADAGAYAVTVSDSYADAIVSDDAVVDVSAAPGMPVTALAGLAALGGLLTAVAARAMRRK